MLHCTWLFILDAGRARHAPDAEHGKGGALGDPYSGGRKKEKGMASTIVLCPYLFLEFACLFVGQPTEINISVENAVHHHSSVLVVQLGVCLSAGSEAAESKVDDVGSSKVPRFGFPPHQRFAARSYDGFDRQDWHVF